MPLSLSWWQQNFYTLLHTCQLHNLHKVSCCLLLSGGLSQGCKGALHAASLDATMWAEGNASSCIEAATCLPLGKSSIKILVLWLAAGWNFCKELRAVRISCRS